MEKYQALKHTVPYTSDNYSWAISLMVMVIGTMLVPSNVNHSCFKTWDWVVFKIENDMNAVDGLKVWSVLSYLGVTYLSCQLNVKSW